ncbi:MAG: FG-GAP repeat protein [Terriglobales bacterium]
MRKAFFLLAFSVAILLPALGQTAPADRGVDNEFVQQQFGDQFTMLPGVAAAFGDLDGDGVEDVIIAARCKNPMLDQAEHNYTVIDPYYEFFGYGDPKVTTTFSEGDPTRRGLVVLIIHGAGKDGWRSAAPKAKYVIVNLPYKTVSIRKMHLKKKNIEAVYVEESGETGESSALFFDGKKFRYVPMGGDMQ